MEDKVYLIIEKKLLDDILSGTLREGDMVPSTHQAAARFDVNPATAARGVSRLSEAGLLEKRRGIGLFVAPGARAAVAASRKARFREVLLPELLEEARRLGISRQELLALVMAAAR